MASRKSCLRANDRSNSHLPADGNGDDFRDLLRLAIRREALLLCAAGAAIFIGSVILDRKVAHSDEVRFWEEFETDTCCSPRRWFHAWLIGDPRYSAILD